MFRKDEIETLKEFSKSGMFDECPFDADMVCSKCPLIDEFDEFDATLKCPCQKITDEEMCNIVNKVISDYEDNHKIEIDTPNEERVIQKLSTAIDIIEAACAHARENLTPSKYNTLFDMSQTVMHELSWANANAMSSIENAISEITRSYQLLIAKFENKDESDKNE